MTQNTYSRWDAPGVENIKPNEDKTAAAIADVMNRMQKKNFARHRNAFRATHVKVQGVVKGTLQVKPDLPEHLQQGMFSEPGKVYDVASRYANEPYLLQPDQEPGPRGFSMKVFGVSGKRLKSEENSLNTQDWFFNNAPSIELTDIDTCLEIMSIRDEHFDDPKGLGEALKSRKDADKQFAPYQLPNTNMASHPFYTQSAFRFGEYYGHLGLFPVVQEQEKQDQTVPQNGNAEVLADWLQDYFRDNNARYELRIQLATDPQKHPTEDGSVVWDEDSAPYQTLAIVTFPKQNSFSQARRVFWEDQMSLSPWSCLEAHQPLGSINRLRKYVYERSKNQRDEINVRQSRFVQSVDEIPN